jgi:GGDEF domain-containing protein
LIWLQANFDRLSDLPHRALFFDRLSQACSTARRNGKQLALLLADLYAFQPVTRQYGHDGGGEWAIIVGNLHGAAEATVIAAKVIASLETEVTLPHHGTCKVRVSVRQKIKDWRLAPIRDSDKALTIPERNGRALKRFVDRSSVGWRVAVLAAMP